MTGMVVSVLTMNLIYWPPKLEGLNAWWLRTFGGELFWPWFTLVGTLVTLAVAWLARSLGAKVRVEPPR